MQRSAILNEAYALATGASTTAFNPQASRSRRSMPAAIAFYDWIGLALALLVAFAGGAWAYQPPLAAVPRPHPGRAGDDGGAAARLADRDPDHARHRRCRCCSRSLRFFSMVSPLEFLFGLNWSPQMAIRADQAGSSGAFGAIPLFWGTIFIGAIIAMIVAIPLGLMSAIYLTQYAEPAAARLDEAVARDPRRRADRGLRLFRRADRRAGDPRPRPRRSAFRASTESALAAGPGHGHHDHPVRLLDGRRLDRRGAAGDARRQPGDGRDQVRDDQAGAGAGRAARRRRRRAARGQPGDRRDDDRGDGRRPRRQSHRSIRSTASPRSPPRSCSC